MLNSVISLPVASEKSCSDRSDIAGSDIDGMAGIAGIMSRADLVMLSIRLGAVSWALAAFMPTISATQINSGFISSPFTGASFE